MSTSIVPKRVPIPTLTVGGTSASKFLDGCCRYPGQENYAYRSEVARNALRDWTQERSLRQQGIDELRQVQRKRWKIKRPAFRSNEVLDRLERDVPDSSRSGR